MKVTWIGHSCFTVEKDGYTVVFDPYSNGSVPGLKNVDLKANDVLCSHEHGDHNGRDCVTLVEGVKNPFVITVIDTYHDESKGSKRGTNKIHIIDDGICKLAHLGDLGCELESGQIRQLKDCDVVLIPVGGFYTIDGKQAAKLMKEIQPRIVIPMHYRDEKLGFGFPVISTVNDFAKEMGQALELHSATVDTEQEYNAQVLILEPSHREA